MKLIDSHCHLDRLDLSDYSGDLNLALAAAKAAHVSHLLCVAIDLENFSQVLAIAKAYDYIYASVGVHPTEVLEQEPTVDDLINLGKDPKVIAVGETGLDYYRCEGEEAIFNQQQRFRNHIRAAKKLAKPVIIHTRQAQADTIRIMQEEEASEVRGVMHCFTEDESMAVAAMELGFCISISGIVTFANAHSLKDLVKQLPLDRLLIETDAPYLAPVPYRGKPNQPAWVYYVAQCVAELKGISIEQVAESTYNNFFELFKCA